MKMLFGAKKYWLIETILQYTGIFHNNEGRRKIWEQINLA